MDILKKNNELLRIDTAEQMEKPLLYSESGPYTRINKIILDNLIEEQDIYEELNKRTNQLVSSFIHHKDSVSFYLIGDKKENEISVWMSNNSEQMANSIDSIYPDAKIDQKSKDKMEQFVQALDLKEHSFATTIPYYSKERIESEQPLVEYTNLVRMMRGKNFALKITCKPWVIDKINAEYELLLQERTAVSQSIDESSSKAESSTESTAYQTGNSTSSNDGVALLVSKQEGTTTNQGETYTSGTTNTDTTNIQKKNYGAIQYDSLIEKYIDRLESMRVQGAFITTIQLFTENMSDLSIMKRGFSSSIFGELCAPIQYYDYTDRELSILKNVDGEYASKCQQLLYGRLGNYVNLFTVREASCFLTPNLQEQNGFRIEQAPRFLQQVSTREGFVIGNLLDYEKDTGNQLRLNENDINKHVLVAGMTGTGKTNTIFSLLKNVDKPFLIIEPAKTEYRVLKSLVKDLRVYTLGREHISPFRMNPFKFDPEKISLQEHIDNLKVIFTAAFTMYASMPNILEQCLINVYTKKGWSLINSKNVLCKDKLIEYYFPTVEDLYAEIDEYIDSLGYAQEQNQNIRAALLTRIKSLMTGAKGFMLNTHNSIEIGELLRYPTVLELEGIVDDTEKALIIGFIMLGVYEHLKGTLEGYAGGLQHIIVMEEAHRLFSNVANNENQEQSNMRGKAVETLSNMLCEIRAYGEGFIIVDQVPTKLAEDVLKNTNTKLIHRLVSRDDCDYIAKSMGMDEKNIDIIPKLKVGQALVYNDKLDGTAHVAVIFNKDNYEYQHSNKIREDAKAYNMALHEEIEANPIVETLLANAKVVQEIEKIVKGYAKRITNESNVSIKDAYQEMKEECIRLVIKQGFELEEGYDMVVQELVNRSWKMILNRSSYSNNIGRKYELLALLSCAMKLAVIEEDCIEKHKLAFEVKRNKVQLLLD